MWFIARVSWGKADDHGCQTQTTCKSVFFFFSQTSHMKIWQVIWWVEKKKLNTKFDILFFQVWFSWFVDYFRCVVWRMLNTSGKNWFPFCWEIWDILSDWFLDVMRKTRRQGQGKTTVVTPLLSFVLADAQRLVVIACFSVWRISQKKPCQLGDLMGKFMWRVPWGLNYHHASHCLGHLGLGVECIWVPAASIVATGSHQVSGGSARTAGVLSVSPSGHFCFSSPKAGSIGWPFADGTSCGIVPIKWPRVTPPKKKAPRCEIVKHYFPWTKQSFVFENHHSKPIAPNRRSLSQRKNLHLRQLPTMDIKNPKKILFHSI